MTQPITYKTHFLLGITKFGADRIVTRWEYTPAQKEIDKAIADAPKDYTSFVLASPQGSELPGNYIDPYAGTYVGC